MGCILDALDDYGTWYLGIVIDEKSWPGGQERRIHFLPYPNSNRDEVFKDEDSARIAPAFNQTDIPSDPEQNFKTLRDYLDQYRQKKKVNQ